MNELLTAKNGLSLDRLRNFCMVAEVGSITKAAQDDSNKQSLFSRQIKELEAYFGTELFKRHGRTLQLTESGARLLRITKEFYSSLEDFAEESLMDQRDLQIGAGDSIVQWLILPQMEALKKVTAGANFTLQNLRTHQIVEKLLYGDLHYGIIRKQDLHADLGSQSIGKLSFKIFFPKALKLPPGKDASIFDSIQLVGMEGVGRYNQCLEVLARDLGVILRFSVKCSSYPMMAKAVRTLGVAAILPHIASEELAEGEFRNRELKAFSHLEHDLVLCWNRKLASFDEESGKDRIGIIQTITQAI